MSVNSIFKDIVDKAFSAMEADAPRSADTYSDNIGMTWHEMRGVNVKCIRSRFGTSSFRPELLILSFTDEAIRFLTAWGLQRSRSFPDPCEHSAIFSTTLLRSNPAVVSLEHLSALADGSSSRLILLIRPAGCDSFATWHDTCPIQASFSRAMALNSHAWVYRRWIFNYGEYSVYAPFVCGNPEATAAEKGATKKKQYTTNIYIYIYI